MTEELPDNMAEIPCKRTDKTAVAEMITRTVL